MLNATIGRQLAEKFCTLYVQDLGVILWQYKCYCNDNESINQNTIETSICKLYMLFNPRQFNTGSLSSVPYKIELM